MEKNRIRPIKTGKSFRMSYSRQQEVLEMPNLIEVQKDSYQWFLDKGLKEVFPDRRLQWSSESGICGFYTLRGRCKIYD